jgi:hypothetical protein
MKLSQNTASSHPSLGEMPGCGLVHTGCAPVTEGDLNGAVTVVFDGFDLSHAIIRHIKHCYGHRVTIVRKNAHHADLATQKAQAHVVSPCLTSIGQALMVGAICRNIARQYPPLTKQNILAWIGESLQV